MLRPARTVLAAPMCTRTQTTLVPWVAALVLCVLTKGKLERQSEESTPGCLDTELYGPNVACNHLALHHGQMRDPSRMPPGLGKIVGG